MNQIHFEKVSTLKGKNLLPGSKFFPFRVDPFSEWKQKHFDRVATPESVYIPGNMQIILMQNMLDMLTEEKTSFVTEL